MAKTKIKKGDTVIVTSGSERGKTGKVVRVTADGERVLVERINVVKRHQKPMGNNPGGIIEKEASIHISNVMLLCPDTNKPTRVGRKRLEDGSGVRVSRRSGEVVREG
jgi:large subunit ribosomal protein L24